MAQKTSWTGGGISQSDINTYMMHEGGAWTTWTPSITQSFAVSSTVTIARYARAGRLIHYYASLAVTSFGATSNDITISVPVTAVTSGLVAGFGYVYDASSNITFHGPLSLSSTSAVKIHQTTGAGAGYLGSASFTAALAAGDAIVLWGFYEAAT